MLLRGLYILMAFGVAGSRAMETRFCCSGTRDPASCRSIQRCHREQLCGTEVRQENGELRFDLGCFSTHDCQRGSAGVLIGRRGPGSHHEAGHHTDGYLCRQCCFHDVCNTDLCNTAGRTAPPTVTSTATRAPTPAPTTLENVPGCYSCKDISDPALCTIIKACHHDSVCGMEVVETNDGMLSFTMDCFNTHECGHDHAGPHHDTTVCKMCCSTAHCNSKQLCYSPLSNSGSSASTGTVSSVPSTVVTNVPFTTPAASTTTSASSTAAPTTPAAPSTTPAILTASTETSTAAVSSTVTSTVASSAGGPFVDIEENGFTCASFDQMNFCTDTTSFVHSLALVNCRAHCGFCTKARRDVNKTKLTDTQTADTAEAACMDDESNGFECASFDAFDFCTDQNSFAYSLALQRCPRHCKFCT